MLCLVMTEWGLRLQVVTSNIYTTCDIVNICLYVCCVSVYAYDRMKYCSVFFRRLRMKFVLIKLKANSQIFFLLLFSNYTIIEGKWVALRKSQQQNVFVPLSWTGRVILKFKKGDLRVCDFMFRFLIFLRCTNFIPTDTTIYGFMQLIIKSCVRYTHSLSGHDTINAKMLLFLHIMKNFISTGFVWQIFLLYSIKLNISPYLQIWHVQFHIKT